MEKKKSMSLQLSFEDYEKLEMIAKKYSMTKTGALRYLIVQEAIKMEESDK